MSRRLSVLARCPTKKGAKKARAKSKFNEDATPIVLDEDSDHGEDDDGENAPDSQHPPSPPLARNTAALLHARTVLPRQPTA
ncbi:hypothetical protein AMAG_19445 [Allomyces macrogynus ATCC 38327]|uniref:Uncharacterized protein n=1 Tax=Allomyces macrogynus (strain ATCC 38327) TaxID=578462 RepID=A0A0L0SS94_ALLM3|nr:hypothetical protein AMAG_19445 [Allomyces macrogynus ATCC 38327]|eukprot:KNE65234.1 hypothetical protein AMAG_19445 [Allomyces macrogynus ATCC 38327]